MAIEIVTLPDIIVNGTRNRAFGGYIYSARITGEYSAAPSSCELTIIFEDGATFSTGSSYFTNSIYEIIINSVVFKGIFWEFEESREADQKTVNITFKDCSVCLDRIWIGLTNQLLKGGEAERRYDTLVVCPDCSIFGDRPQFEVIVTRRSYGAFSNIGHGYFLNGGYGVLGEEGFHSAPCDFGEIEYTFDSLITLLRSFGINFAQLPASELQRNYTGTARSVLSNWCADFGYDFYWDYSNNILNFIDLREGITIDVSGIDEDYITSKRTLLTLDGTFAQGVSSRSVKAEENISFQRKGYSRISLNYLDVANVMGRYGGWREKNQFKVSCGLSKYNETLRKIFNLYVAGQGMNGDGDSGSIEPLSTDLSETPSGSSFGNPTPDEENVFAKCAYEVCGITMFGYLNLLQTSDFFTGIINSPSLSELVNAYKKYNYAARIIVGKYDQRKEQAWVEFEKSMADQFLGHFYTSPLDTSPRSFRFCDYENSFKAVYEYGGSPQLTRYTSEGGEPLPFLSFAQFADLDDVITDKSNIILFERSPVWSHTEDEFNSILGLENVDVNSSENSIPASDLDLTDCLPSYMSIDGTLADQLHQFLTDEALIDPEIITLEVLSKYQLILIPGFNEFIKPNFNISFDYSSGRNKMEKGYTDDNIDAQTDFDCILKCEADDSTIFCQPNCVLYGEQEAPQEGLRSLNSWGFTVTAYDNQIRVVAPVESSYSGFITRDINVSYFVPPKIEIINSFVSSSAVAEVRLVDNDFTGSSTQINDITAPTMFYDDSGQLNKTLRDLHDDSVAENLMLNYQPTQNMTIRIAGLDFGSVSQSGGLQNLNISLDSKGGYTTELTFSSKPKQPAKKQ